MCATRSKIGAVGAATVATQTVATQTEATQTVPTQIATRSKIGAVSL